MCPITKREIKIKWQSCCTKYQRKRPKLDQIVIASTKVLPWKCRTELTKPCSWKAHFYCIHLKNMLFRAWIRWNGQNSHKRNPPCIRRVTAARVSSGSKHTDLAFRPVPPHVCQCSFWRSAVLHHHAMRRTPPIIDLRCRIIPCGGFSATGPVRVRRIA